MAYAPPRVGAALQEDVPKPARGPDAAQTPEGGLCGTCSRAPVCAVRAAIRLVGGEGLIAVGACPYHEDNAPTVSEEDWDEPEGEPA